jgi:hypothetical protein
MGAVDNLTLNRWHGMDAVAVLTAFSDRIKLDPTFKPTSSHLSSRWTAYAAGRDWELLCTGPKFWDTRAECGGGGAIDLVMHLHRTSFKGAVALLKDKDL